LKSFPEILACTLGINPSLLFGCRIGCSISRIIGSLFVGICLRNRGVLDFADDWESTQCSMFVFASALPNGNLLSFDLHLIIFADHHSCPLIDHNLQSLHRNQRRNCYLPQNS
jgi:hypothetical protein